MDGYLGRMDGIKRLDVKRGAINYVWIDNSFALQKGSFSTKVSYAILTFDRPKFFGCI